MCPPPIMVRPAQLTVLRSPRLAAGFGVCLNWLPFDKPIRRGGLPGKIGLRRPCWRRLVGFLVLFLAVFVEGEEEAALTGRLLSVVVSAAVVATAVAAGAAVAPVVAVGNCSSEL